MFHSDFKKQADAAGHLMSLIKSQGDGILSSLDLFLKWSWIELVLNTNTQIYKAVLELNVLLVNTLETFGYFLTDTEANLILPILCEKSGQNNAVFRTMIRGLIHSFCKVYQSDRVFSIVVQGISSKNARTKVECIEELGCLIVDFGIEIAQPRDVKFISKQVNSTDNNVRTAAVDTMTEVFKIVGDKTWTLIGEVPDKVRGILDQRFRTVKVKIFEPSKIPEFLKPAEEKPLEFTELYSDEKNYFGNKAESGKNYEFLKFTDQFKAPTNLSIAEKLQQIEKIEKNEKVNKNEKIGKNERFQDLGQEDKNFMKKVQNLSEKKLLASKSEPDIEENPIPFQKPEKFEEFFHKKVSLSKADENTKEELHHKEESKHLKPIQELRNAFKEKKLQQLRESIQVPKIDQPKVSELQQTINSLESCDISKQLEGLKILHDKILENLSVYEEDLMKHSCDLMKTITKLTHMLLTNTEPSGQFLGYFLKVVQKVCSIDFIVKQLTEAELAELCEKYVLGLSSEKLEKSGENNEGELVVKTLNSSVIKILELAKPSEIFPALLSLLIKYKSQNIGKMSGILIRCLLKLTKSLTETIQEIKIEKLILDIHLYLSANNNTTDELGIKAMRTIINELVKILGEEIWVSLNKIKGYLGEENIIEQWIHIILGSNTIQNNPLNKQKVLSDELVYRLMTSELYAQAVKDLYEIIEKNQNIDFSAEISRLPNEISEKIAGDLIELKKKKTEVSQSCNFSDMKSRLASMKQRYPSDNQTGSTAMLELNAKVNSIVNKPEAGGFKSRIQKFSKK